MPQTLNPTGAPSVFGGLGRLEWSAGNPDDPFPVWQDITTFVRTEDNPLRITRGRQSELDQVQPSQLTCDLDNTDSRFTFGYTAGPYGATWTPAKKVRYSETIAGRTFVYFTGWIEFPDISDWQPIGRQYVQLTCTDRLTRLSRGRKFVSTLGEYILHSSAGSQLVNFWTLADSSNTTQGQYSGNSSLAIGGSVIESQTPGAASFTPNDATSILGDDLTPGLFAPVTGLVASVAKTLFWSSVRTLVTTDPTVTVAWWQYWDDANPNPTPQPIVLSGSPNIIQVFFDTGAWKIFDGTLRTLPNLLPTRKWTFLAVHWTASSLDFYQDANPPVSFAHSLGPLNAKGIVIGQSFAGSMAYVQIYDGPLYDNIEHAAQFRMGLYGLEGQLTGARINTLLDYAGVPSTDRAIDPGVSYMQRAKLAGLDPYTAIQQAVAVERGRFIAAGDGRAVFHDRIRILNV